jgi:hypothetical protein
MRKALVFCLLLVGTFLNVLNVNAFEISRQEAARNPNARAGAEVVFIQPYECTWAVYRIYTGSYSHEQAVGNINGQPAFYDDYMTKFVLHNAIKYNLANPASIPNVKILLLDPGKTYTIVREVFAGAFGKRFSRIEVFHITPSNHIGSEQWTDAWNRTTYVNRVIITPGSNSPAYDTIDLAFTVYPNEIVRRGIARLTGR